MLFFGTTFQNQTSPDAAYGDSESGNISFVMLIYYSWFVRATN